MDDLIITASKPSAIDDLLCNLKTNFAIKDLGNLNFFLGVEVLLLNFFLGVEVLPNSSSLVLSYLRNVILLIF